MFRAAGISRACFSKKSSRYCLYREIEMPLTILQCTLKGDRLKLTVVTLISNPPGIHYPKKFREMFCSYPHLKHLIFLEHIYEAFFKLKMQARRHIYRHYIFIHICIHTQILELLAKEEQVLIPCSQKLKRQ